MDNEKNPIQKNLDNLFKDFIPAENAPEEMKQEVFQTLDTLNLIGDIADLFTDKFTRTEVDFLDILNDEIQPEEAEEEE